MATVDFFCDVCRFFYIVEDYEVSEQKKLHRKYHDEFVNGVKTTVQKNDNVIFELNDFRVVLVSPNSSTTQRKRAERVAFRSKKDTHFDFAPYHADDTKHKDYPLAFIGIIKNRAISFLVLRKAKATAKVTWEYYNQEDRENIPLSPDERWGVSMIWVLENKRRMGNASKLVKIASDYVGNSISEMAWFTPFTEFGSPLAKHLAPHEIILTI